LLLQSRSVIGPEKSLTCILVSLRTPILCKTLEEKIVLICNRYKINNYLPYQETPGNAVDGRVFDSRWCHWNFFIEIILPAALWHGGWLSR